MCQELPSGVGTRSSTWLGGKGSVPPKRSAGARVAVCCCPTGTSPRPLCSQEEPACADVGKCSGECAAIADQQRLSFGARAALWGEAGNSNGGVRALFSCTGRVVIISDVQTFMLLPCGITEVPECW